MTFEKAIEKIFEGNCILFTGSGFSLGAKNVLSLDSKIKSAPQLAELLYKDSGYTSSNKDLKKAATAYLKKKTADDLIHILKQEFTISEISPDQKYIGSHKWARIYTTNYDDIIEFAYRQNRTGEYLTPVTLSDHPNSYPDKSKIAIHLNGYVNNLTADSLNSEFRLVNRSYLAEDFIKSKWIEIFRGDIKACDAIFFVGFSLDYDLDIARIIHNSDIKDKAFFIVWDEEDEINLETLSEFGDVQPINLSGFVEKIKEIHKNYVPAPIKLFMPLCFSQPTLRNSLPEIRDKDFYDLLLLGNLNEHILYYSLLDPNKYKYFSLRKDLETVINDIQNGTNNILVEANLGNGKTLFLRALSILLAKRGYKVFFFEKYRTCIDAEIQKICEDFENAVVIFDDYHTVKEQISFFNLRRKNQILITSERTHFHEVIFDEIEDTIGEYKTININFLNDDEINEFDKYLDCYSLWKEYTTDRQKRINYMINSCKRQMCHIILSRIKSSDLSGRIQNVLSNISKKRDFNNALIIILISESFHFRLELGELVEMLGTPTLNNPGFKANPEIKEFVNFEDNKITFKSSILSQYILGNIISPDLIIDSLISIANYLDNKYDIHKPSKDKFISIINFRTIQKSINIKDPIWKREIFRFYETVRSLNFCQNNIHFWLQYAIARLSDYNYEIAEAYFDKCYELAKTVKNYDTYKVDNHYCRFILENEIENGNISTCMTAFNYAHSILINTRRGDEKKYYPFKVAGLYERFYKKFFAQLENHHKKKFLDACDEMHQKCQKYLSVMGAVNVKYVHDTKRSLENILNENLRS